MDENKQADENSCEEEAERKQSSKEERGFFFFFGLKGKINEKKLIQAWRRGRTLCTGILLSEITQDEIAPRFPIQFNSKPGLFVSP